MVDAVQSVSTAACEKQRKKKKKKKPPEKQRAKIGKT
jgi:hypothetical protein